MKLNEILNKKIDYEVIHETSGMFKTSAIIGNRTIIFIAIEEEPGNWELSFGEKISNGKTTYDKTGSGSELEVFSMVKSSIEEFIQRYSPPTMFFTADKDQVDTEVNVRSAVYDRLIKRFNIPGYKYTRLQTKTHDLFTLDRE